MYQKFTESSVRTIVEHDTNYEYSLVHIEKTGGKDRKTGKKKKREMTIKHNNCGHIYTIPLYEFTDGKRRCAKCKGKGLREHFAKSIESVKQETIDMTDGEYEFVDKEYFNSKQKHLFLHRACNKTFKKSWDKFRGGQGCTHCQRKGMESSASRQVRDILDHFKIDYICEKRFDDCINPKTGKVLPFDYYLPDANALIEVDGEQHERATFTSWDLKGTIKRDKIKNKYAKRKGIELVRIPAKKWSQLTEFLHSILSKDLLKDLTLQEINDVPCSTHPVRITKDLHKVHDGEYVLEDNFYHGVDRKHNFKHLTCGTVFKESLYGIKIKKYPCPVCRKKHLSQNRHNKTNKQVIQRSGGRYSLDHSLVGIDSMGRRLVRCHKCHTSWKVVAGNLMRGKAGCPNCLQIKKDKEWREKYTALIKAVGDGKEISKSQKHWIWGNMYRNKDSKQKKKRLGLLRKAHLI